MSESTINKIVQKIEKYPEISDDTLFCAFMTCTDEDLKEARFRILEKEFSGWENFRFSEIMEQIKDDIGNIDLEDQMTITFSDRLNHFFMNNRIMKDEHLNIYDLADEARAQE